MLFLKKIILNLMAATCLKKICDGVKKKVENVITLVHPFGTFCIFFFFFLLLWLLPLEVVTVDTLLHLTSSLHPPLSQQPSACPPSAHPLGKEQYRGHRREFFRSSLICRNFYKLWNKFRIMLVSVKKRKDI